MRKPVAATPLGSGTMVICDDGSAWMLVPPSTQWVEAPPIPGSKRDGEDDLARPSGAYLGGGKLQL